jgi:hypothetical protein
MLVDFSILRGRLLTWIIIKKVAERLEMRVLIPDLGSAHYDAIFHPDYASDEETDPESTIRRLVVKRPASRANWVSLLISCLQNGDYLRWCR